VKLTTRPRPLPRSRIVELYLHSPERLHGVVLNYLSRVTTSPEFDHARGDNPQILDEEEKEE
jgi:hypothetical protein